jgi:F0F1-type ATP synthase assembly protein I
MAEFEEKFIKPIVNASYPATLAGLDLAVLQFSASPGKILSLTFLLGGTAFVLAAFSIFSYTIYPTRKKMWTSSALSFILGLSFSVIAILVLVIRVFLPGFLILPGEPVPGG